MHILQSRGGRSSGRRRERMAVHENKRPRVGRGAHKQPHRRWLNLLTWI